MPRSKKGQLGSSFDAFLAEQGILETCEEQAVKQILAGPLIAATEKDKALWEEIQDGLIAQERESEEGISYEEYRATR